MHAAASVCQFWARAGRRDLRTPLPSILVLWSLIGVFGCGEQGCLGQQKQPRAAELEALQQQVQALQAAEHERDLAPLVEDLDALTIRDPAIRNIKAQCSSGFGALAETQAAQVRAKNALEGFERGTAAPSTQELDMIAEDIERARLGADASQKHITDCLQSLRKARVANETRER